MRVWVVRTVFTMMVSVMVVAAGGREAAANLFTNPTFDTDAAGWTLTGGCTSASFNGGTGNPPGSILLNACGESASNPAAAQTVGGLDVGATYQIGWENRLHVNQIGANGDSFGVGLDTVLIDTSENLSTSFLADSTTFTATSSSHTISFQGEVDPTDVSYFLDNVSLECIRGCPTQAVPLPATVVLLGLAMTGLAAVRHVGRRNS